MKAFKYLYTKSIILKNNSFILPEIEVKSSILLSIPQFNEGENSKSCNDHSMVLYLDLTDSHGFLSKPSSKSIYILSWS